MFVKSCMMPVTFGAFESRVSQVVHDTFIFFLSKIDCVGCVLYPIICFLFPEKKSL